MRRGVGAMATSAAARVEADHAWFAALSAEDRSWIGVIAHGGITSFLSWLENPHVEGAGAIDVFADAPRELTRSISLEQTLDLLRTVIEVVEEEAPQHARAEERAETGHDQDAGLVPDREEGEARFRAAERIDRRARRAGRHRHRRQPDPDVGGRGAVGEHAGRRDHRTFEAERAVGSQRGRGQGEREGEEGSQVLHAARISTAGAR